MDDRKLNPVFVFLTLAVFFAFFLVLGFLWVFNIFGPSVLVNIFFLVLSLILSLIFLVLVAGFLGIWLLIRNNRIPFFLHTPMVLTVNYFMGFVIRVGQLLGLSREKLQRSYINLTNKLVESLRLRFSPEEILVLAPHCIQEASCPHRITHDLNNCKRCGKCQIGNLTEMQQELGFRLAVVTGGTGARQVVKKMKPRAIVAIACERDLMSGIQDVFPHPVLGVVNIRPHGPCLNTEVDWTELETAIKSLCKEAE